MVKVASDEDVSAVEAKVDTAIIDIGTVDTAVGAVQTDLSNVDDGLGALKALIDTANAAITSIQNVTRFVAGVPKYMQKPDAGNTYFYIRASLYDTVGNMEDPDADGGTDVPCVKIVNQTGVDRSANVCKVNDGTEADASTNFVGYKKLVRTDTGKFECWYDVANDATEEQLALDFAWREGGINVYQPRASQVADVTGDLTAILMDTGTTIPGRLDTVDGATTGIAAQLPGALEGGYIKANIYATQDIDLSATQKASVQSESDTAIAKVATCTTSKITDAVVARINADITSRAPAGEYNTEMGRIDVGVGTRSSHGPADVRGSVCATGDAANTIGKILYELENTRLTAVRANDLDATVAGKLQMTATTVDLHQAAASYEVLEGLTQDVIVEKVIFQTPLDLSDDAGFTGISIQTDDTTPQAFVLQEDGVKANLTAGAQVGFVGATLLKVGKHIKLTIYGDTATVEPTTCEVIVECRAVVSGGSVGTPT